MTLSNAYRNHVRRKQLQVNLTLDQRITYTIEYIGHEDIIME